jgi:rhamnose transport system permease protein
MSSETMAVPSPFSPQSLRRFFLRREWLLVLLIVAMTVVNSRLSPFFLNQNNLLRTSSDFMEIGIMVLAMVLVIVTGNIDLSVASILGLCASFMGWLFMNGVDIWVAVPAALLLGMAAGWLNGVLVAKLKLPSLVVTLGTYSFYRGMAYVLLGDQAARGYPPSFTFLGQGTLGDSRVPFSLLLFGVLAVVFALLLHRTTFGRYLYAIGNNEEASRYAGVPVDRAKIIIYMLSGLMAAVAGIVLAARFGSTRPDIGTGLELTVITVTVLGGVSIFGGSGTMAGAVLSLVLIGITRFGMGLVNIQGQTQDIIIGLLLILSIMLPRFNPRAIRTVLAQRGTALAFIGGGAVFVAFLWFFFWSRAIVLATG